MTLHFHFKELKSTNDYAKQYVQLHLPKNSLVVTADNQQKGRGTNGKYWYSEKNKQLLLSYCSPFNTKKINPETITPNIGKIIKETMDTLFDINLTLKWPNDLFLNDKKCGGILTEIKTRGTQSWIIIGVGINIHPMTFPSELTQLAISLNLDQKNSISRLKQALINKFKLFVENNNDINTLNKK